MRGRIRLPGLSRTWRSASSKGGSSAIGSGKKVLKSSANSVVFTVFMHWAAGTCVLVPFFSCCSTLCVRENHACVSPVLSTQLQFMGETVSQHFGEGQKSPIHMTICSSLGNTFATVF